ncbi:ATP-binding protein [Variovorax rhizosphaerae]|uniref:histidine kinase n=1 Tax=Variovorax rhizosphaerae TaxID=1836200 RepID=A0ABU8WNR7_9BURK
MTSLPPLVGPDDGALFCTLFDAYPDALLLVDPQGMIRLANPSAVEVLGYSVEQLIGLSVEQLVPDAMRSRHAAWRESYAGQPRIRAMGTQMDLVARRQDGSEVMVEIALSPLQDHGLPYVVAAIRSVSEYPRVKQALQRARYSEQLARFGRLAVEARDSQQLLALAPVIASEALQAEMAKVLLLEASGLEFRIAAGVGLLPQEAAGHRLPNEPGSPSGHVVATGKSVAVGDYASEQRFTIPAHYLQAGLVCELSVPLGDRGRTIGTLAVRSRRPHHFGEDEVRFLESLSSMLATVMQRTASEEALHHAQRLESVGQLTGCVAHDFNNLLTVISGNLQMLEELPACADDPAVRQLVGAAYRAARRGGELTGKLLAFSRRQVLQPTVVDTRALLASLTGMLARTLDQRIALRIDTRDALCIADSVQLESALLNVVINARDAMPQGGTITFTSGPAVDLPAELEAEAGLSPDGYVAIAITDTGAGMPESVRERAFEPFFTTKEAGRGTGLGLATVYGFTRQSHGASTLRSTPGEGTTVTLYLPRVAERPPVDEDAGAERPRRVRAGVRVLLVEDDPEVRKVIQAFLAAMACEAFACANGEQALQLLDAGRAFDLLLTDIVLGTGLRGSELADRVRERAPDLPVLLMSGYSSVLLDDESQGRELLRKPCSRADLERAMAKVLGP